MIKNRQHVLMVIEGRTFVPSVGEGVDGEEV